MSLPAALVAFIPSQTLDSLDDLFFIIIGWIICMTLTIVEYLTSLSETKKQKSDQRKELFSKMIVYTLLFFGLKFFHLWTSYGSKEYLSSVVYFLVMVSYALVMLGEFKFIGENLKLRYGKKPSIFEFFDKLEKTIRDRVIKKVEKTCNLEEEK